MPRPLNLADVLEAIADAVPDRPAVVTLDRTWTYREVDERATRLADHLRGLGVRPGDHVAVHSANRIEWVEAFYGCFKARAVPINVNYKYLRDELAHVYGDAGCVAAVVAPEHAEDVRAVAPPALRHLLVLGEEYDAALAAASPERPADPGRSEDDHYTLYTGGTTGKPKGVVWRHADIIRAALNASRLGAPIESVEQLATEAAANQSPMVLLACGPMMHGGSQWILGNAHVSGSTVAFYDRPSFDPETILDLVQHARVVSLTFLGDAMGRPVAEAILAEPDRWDLSSLVAVSNGAAPLSDGVREEIRRALPGRFILDTYGSSESGATASRVDDGSEGPVGAPRFNPSPDVEVFDHELRPCPVGVDGMLARSGPMPLGYHNDPARTAATFKEVDGRRWSIPGDVARREEDGSITVLGRGSVCINTGGEKVHPEEVEAVLLRHDDVFDAVVVGTPHERWGQQVTALVQRREGSAVDDEQLRTHVRTLLSSYKVPKEVRFVDQVPRTAVSKVDYAASRELALELLDRPEAGRSSAHPATR
ncbi:AMP-binding protein [Nocardioides marmoribigeumensis]|uniref:Acyl-CoA synthetase (AMP-forming)/AMP-acid ligase II n=1 Tax=Nocardioides marmoribigeumensis TaxID=433649 RepID=A0ABU2BY44_9ACTN|nr:AMP-binding protein [Nocardioides marmoribigeumensis]MDR7363321.1 acyl-CoA synthetase (AMP-forming)/AMP-acid ligase II [Nocardioides marmoribigeumensis]